MGVVELRLLLPSPIPSIPHPGFPGLCLVEQAVSGLQGLEPQLPAEDGSCEQSLWPPSNGQRA